MSDTPQTNDGHYFFVNRHNRMDLNSAPTTPTADVAFRAIAGHAIAPESALLLAAGLAHGRQFIVSLLILYVATSQSDPPFAGGGAVAQVGCGCCSVAGYQVVV